MTPAPDPDAEAAWLHLVPELRRLVRDLDWRLGLTHLLWAEIYALEDRIPRTPATLSLRARLTDLDEALREAVRLVLSVGASLAARLDQYPLPEDVPPDERTEEPSA